MEKRSITFECSHCTKTFRNDFDISGDPRVSLSCPSCHTELVADLTEYARPSSINITKGGTSPNTSPTLPLSGVVPTKSATDTET